MKIKWYGHAAFQVETGGTRVILDPYRAPDCGGYGAIDEAAEVVVVSHENDRYHSHVGQIRGEFELLKALEFPAGGVEVRGIRFEAIRCFESPEKLPGDEVTIVHFRAEGLHVVHLGDLGHALEPAEVEPLRGADVVMLPAGGPPTIELELVPALLEAMEPRIVVPMHYLIPGKIDLKIQPVDRLLERLAGWRIERPGASELVVDVGEDGTERRLVWLEPAR